MTTLTTHEMAAKLSALGLMVETVNLPPVVTVARILDTKTGDYITDAPDLVSGRYIGMAEFDAFLLGFFAGRTQQEPAIDFTDMLSGEAV